MDVEATSSLRKRGASVATGPWRDAPVHEGEKGRAARSAFVGTLLPVHRSHVLPTLGVALGVVFGVVLGCAPPSPAAGSGAKTVPTEEPAQLTGDDARAQPPSPPTLATDEGPAPPPERVPADRPSQARPWVFAREGCLRLSDGVGRRSYRDCVG